MFWYLRFAKQNLQDIHSDSLISITYCIAHKLIKCIEIGYQNRDRSVVEEMHWYYKHNFRPFGHGTHFTTSYNKTIKCYTKKWVKPHHSMISHTLWLWFFPVCWRGNGEGRTLSFYSKLSLKTLSNKLALPVQFRTHCYEVNASIYRGKVMLTEHSTPH